MLDNLVNTVVTQSGSDLHLSEGRVPVIRVAGFLIPLVNEKALTRADIDSILGQLLTPAAKKDFDEKKNVDFAYSHKAARFRGNAFYTLGRISVALRLIPKQIRTLAELNLPSVLEMFAGKQQGFFLCVGPAGHGKSTTLATLIEIINTQRLEHIVTIEDPVEYIFEPKKAIIDQREVNIDTADFHTALRNVFRQDVDVVMVGEMRDAETISTAVTAAETGHLVFSTLHTNTASQTVDRIIDSFPADQQGQIRIQLAGSLAGIFSQRLIPRVSGGLIPAYELLINNGAVANLIRDKRTHEISSVIETSSESGMIDLNRSLAGLVRNGDISVENAYLYSTNPKTLEKML
ncbi:MAG: type IV pili twitching motility protein PilT [Candidatus Zambryskibacteria bacterium RIFCSPHIGHO2_12_FULL_43_12b]|uniref:Type IV pili twitching motility protein PilT n=1 Tax=Candidatus Zambryskibacteria bacterium RIFCSPLOWO2_01_FULL_43_17 TaxID=1802760 RepID=A0A1G2U0X4_9BACT|nr:MAG: type IV pili twitching motility protein PilT [Candidatus Zambryskibacteria bacterium RIFCSPHIGHO2_12_FULL_43_12b]OHB03181.1 MAG: type IV pili twitching motility protein PilT [Candidatus Zambryskibacteria bacterium RIFCSPLOWO2_01_FULL_43_17]